MTSISSELLKTVSNGLIRQSAGTCSAWALRYVKVGNPFPGPLTFDHHPWSKAMCDCNQDWVGKKAAQLGFTHNALMRCIFSIDIKRLSVLYLLPKRSPDATDFSKTKFDALLENSPHIENLFSSTKNVGHKQAGDVSFFLRGARSKSGLKSISTPIIVFDEYDEMPSFASGLAKERGSGFLKEARQKIKLSTPTVPEYGIDYEYTNSTQEIFVFKCPICSRYSELTFPDSLVICGDNRTDPDVKRSHIICSECKSPINNDQKKHQLRKTGIWHPRQTNDIRGFYVNQLHSFTIEPWEIAEAKFEFEESSDEVKETEWYNSKGGVSHVVEGARVIDTAIAATLGSHKLDDPAKAGIVTMGVDIGRWIHYWIDLWTIGDIGPDMNSYAIPKTLNMGKVAEFEELDQLMFNYQVLTAVVDSDPDHRSAKSFALRFFGHAYLNYFNTGAQARSDFKVNEEEHVISTHRTSWLDLSQGRFKSNRIILPNNTPDEVKRHIKALIRKPERDRFGNPTAKYINIGPDHYAFARVYSEIALPLAVAGVENRNIGDLL